MEQIALDAAKRNETGKTHVRKSRQNGIIPAVLYGKKTETISIAVEKKALEKVLGHGAAHKIVNLKIKSENSPFEEKLCVIHEIQRDTFGTRVLHVDFHHISMEEKLTTKVPVALEGEGEAPGIREGGILDHVLWEIEIRALPLNLPEKLTVNISHLSIHQSIHVKDIPLPQGVEILEDSEEIVAVIHPPRVEEMPVVAAAPTEGAAPSAGTAGAPATTGGTAPAQPEVISKGKKEEVGAGEEKTKK